MATLPGIMYFDTVDWATSKPSINCSPPWVFLAHPSDEIAQLSIEFDRHARLRDFQNAVKPARCHQGWFPIE